MTQSRAEIRARDPNIGCTFRFVAEPIGRSVAPAPKAPPQGTAMRAIGIRVATVGCLVVMAGASVFAARSALSTDVASDDASGPPTVYVGARPAQDVAGSPTVPAEGAGPDAAESVEALRAQVRQLETRMAEVVDAINALIERDSHRVDDAPATSPVLPDRGRQPLAGAGDARPSQVDVLTAKLDELTAQRLALKSTLNELVTFAERTRAACVETDSYMSTPQWLEAHSARLENAAQR